MDSNPKIHKIFTLKILKYMINITITTVSSLFKKINPNTIYRGLIQITIQHIVSSLFSIRYFEK